MDTNHVPDDELDGCDVDLTVDPVPDDELDLVVLSPEGDPEKINEYARLFGGDGDV